MEYKLIYYLVDAIYRELVVVLKYFTCLLDENNKLLKEAQESIMKYMEWAFGVFKPRWHILSHPTQSMNPKKLRQSMYACII